MSYRALMIADLHLGNTLPYAQRVDGLVTDRLLDGVAVLEQLGQYAAENDITDVYSVGDLQDKRLVDAPTAKLATAAAARLVDEYLLRLHLIPGNHESADAGGLAYCLEGWNQLRPGSLFVYGDGAVIEPKHGPRLWTLPYKPDRIAAERVRMMSANAALRGGVNVALLHQSIKGGKAGSWVCPHGIDPTDVEGFAAVFAGHFHTHQDVTSTMQFLGAGMQHTFADLGEQRGFWDVTIEDDGTVKQTLVEARAPRFYSADWQDIDEDPPTGSYVEIRYRGTRAQLAQLKPDVDAYCAELLKNGARWVKPVPVIVAEKKERAAIARDAGGRVTWPSAVAGYLDACNLEGLERARLEEIANNALAEAMK